MKKAVVDITIRMVLEMGDDYDENDVNFRLNESSYCISGEIEALGEKSKEASDKNMCNMCYRKHGEFVRWLEPGEDESKAVSI